MLSVFTPHKLCVAVLVATAALSAKAETNFINTSPAVVEAGSIAIEPDSRPFNLLTRVIYWNNVAVNASGLDHTPVAEGESRVFGEQLGPHRASRAMAMVQIAVFDALNAARGSKYKSYTSFTKVPGNVSADAAIAQAAHDTLAALYPSQAASFDQLLALELANIAQGERAKQNGAELGRRTAAAILALRAADGSQYTEPKINIDYIPSDQPGAWRQDPVAQQPVALGAPWGQVTPFAIQNVHTDFRLPTHPALNSPEYTAAYNEVKRLGGDGLVTATDRSADETIAGIYWAYDGTPSLCAPPRLYNQVAQKIAEVKRLRDPLEYARMLGLINVAMADAGVAAWDNKFHHALWRPVAGIRESDVGTGASGLGDGNEDTVGDESWYPLGGPASNSRAPNFTPPFPAYPSGHATFGGALFQTLRVFFGTDSIPFTFVSDEFNGETTDNEGNVRPLVPRSFTSLSQAEAENGRSRVYLGVHWQFDSDTGIELGRHIADQVVATTFVRK